MKRILAFLICLFIIIPLWAQDSSREFLPMFDKTPNAAIKGFNDKHLTDVTLEEAAEACVNGSYLSFDYNKKTKEADLSYATAQSAGRLKTDYPDNPYDHYSYLGGLQPSFFQENKTHIKALVKTDDDEQIADVSILSIRPSCYMAKDGQHFFGTKELGDLMIASVYLIKLRLNYSDGIQKDIELLYCPRCDLYYMGPSFEKGLYSDINHSGIPFYTGKEQPSSDKKNLIVVDNFDNHIITYRFLK